MEFKKKSKRKRIVSWIIDGLFYMAVLGFIGLMLQIFCFSNFKIPTDSMEPSLLAGDRIIVDKMTKGARLFNLYDAFQGEKVNISRTPGFGDLKRNDVLVFNFPYAPHKWDSIAFDVLRYYVKRCIALPGDTLEIKNGYFKVRGYAGKLGILNAQKRIAVLPDTGTVYGVERYTYPWKEGWNWDIKHFGPLPVPKQGQIVRMNATTVALYQQLIEWEQRKKITVHGDSVLLGNDRLRYYRFKENYYFVAGDKAENSQDSRYWGLLPEPFIVGKAVLIWRSEHPLTGKMRWNRFLKTINYEP